MVNHVLTLQEQGFHNFQKYVAGILAPPLRTFRSRSLRTPSLERIDRYFEDYKLQIKKRLGGIGQPAKWERDGVQAGA